VRRFKKIEIKVSLFDVAPLTTWMHENGMPFLAKFHHQNQWTGSKKAAPFMTRFRPEHRKSRMDKNGVERPIKFHLICQRSDWDLIEMWIKLRWPRLRIGTPKRKKVAHPVARKVSKIIAA
jgi:hypothetical protein